MTKPDELELFDYLSRQHKLREWLNEKLADNLKVLVLSPDVEQLRRAQGQSVLLQHMLELMDKAPAAVKR